MRASDRGPEVVVEVNRIAAFQWHWVTGLRFPDRWGLFNVREGTELSRLRAERIANHAKCNMEM